ncbi:hypothetical protein BcDW1_10882 [Botrytis cinerea BcDW1]|uniref:Uncharacterized protein n=1 Tax=Botryotinia fuckeliana (strain BcDW1) TaxID=1290391 RepID=M7UAU2_BOTF1|nr:hypothetical protein BcDW1_10882 [Botrytis cinerea BcDW1]
MNNNKHSNNNNNNNNNNKNKKNKNKKKKKKKKKKHNKKNNQIHHSPLHSTADVAATDKISNQIDSFKHHRSGSGSTAQHSTPGP